MLLCYSKAGANKHDQIKRGLNMAATEAQKKAVSKYRKEKQKTITIVLHKELDKDILEYLEKQKSKSGTIKELLRIAALKDDQ